VMSIIPTAQMFLQRKDPDWITWLPIAGQYSLLARALRGEALPMLALVQSFAVPALLTILSLLLVSRLLSRESVLAGR
jgi:hypothetical protein